MQKFEPDPESPDLFPIEWLLEPLVTVFDWIGNAFATILGAILFILAKLLIFIIEEGFIYLLGVLIIIVVIGQIMSNIYNVNFKNDNTDKIMKNKNETGFFHPENIEKSVEEESGLLNMRKTHLWITDNSPPMDLVANFRKKNNWKVSIPVYDDNDISIEAETVIKFTDVYCGNCYMPREDADVFCGQCGSLITDATKKFEMEENLDESGKKFWKVAKEFP
jgi:hypothetical protein